ncbi:MAG: hypothetical protein OXF76_02125 [Caldilineaceae bacterium]|nr:hypothetical protein [Caldilineaceae bacterium]
MGLDWRTLEEEDEQGQVEALEETEPDAARRRAWPWWLTSALVLLLAAAVIWGVRYVLAQRLEAITATFEVEVLAAHGTVQMAERDLDEALFSSMISTDYPNWGDRQKRMLREGMRWDRRFFGLTMAPEADGRPPPGTVTDIEFTSDWRMATVTVAYPYQQTAGPAVTLHQSITYREGETGWALVPAYPDYWGEKRKLEGRYVTVEFPERDAATVERLVEDWDELLAAACETLEDLDCRGEWKLDVALSTESSALTSLAEGAPPGMRWMEAFNAPLPEQSPEGSGLTLPTPSLIGRPADDAGYAALRAGYAPLIAGGGIAEIVGWRCCENEAASTRRRARGRSGAIFFRALLDKQLSQLGLVRWPVNASTYEEILQGTIHDVTNLHWVYLQRSGNSVEPHIWKVVYSMVDFILAEQPEQSAARLQRALRRNRTYRPWLTSAGFSNFGRSIQKRWIDYADGQLAAAATAAGDALPAQDLQLLCAADRFQGAHVYRYTFENDAFASEDLDGTFRLMYALPDADGVLLQRTGGRVNAEANDSPVQIWRRGWVQRVTYRDSNTPLFAVDSSDSGMLFYTYESRRPTYHFTYLDLAACEQGTCALESQQGFPVWSPDRKRSIVSLGDGLLWLGDGAGELLMTVAHGRSVAWLDNERFAYFQPDDEMRVGVMTLPQMEAETVLELERLAEAMRAAPGARRRSSGQPLPITPAALATHPSWPDQLIVAMREGDRWRSEATHIFTYNLAADELRHLLWVEHPLESIRSLRFSADGRWLFVHSVERSTDSWHLHLYDSESGASQTYSSESTLAFPGYDLSADGAWLVRVDEGFLHLIPLQGGRQRLVAHSFARCHSAVWVEGSFE